MKPASALLVILFMLCLVVVAAIAEEPAPASAVSPGSTYRLYESCKRGITVQGGGIDYLADCLRFLVGFSYGVRASNKICVPETKAPPVIMNDFMLWAEKQSINDLKGWHESEGTLKFFLDTYPCK